MILFLQWLIDANGYRDPKPIGNGRYACIQPKLFTHSIAIGRIGDKFGIDDFWCYPDYPSAKRALDAWDGSGEPVGWHRHTPSGRRIAPPEGAFDGDGRWVRAGKLYVRE
jgi:hypothetical protein